MMNLDPHEQSIIDSFKNRFSPEKNSWIIDQNKLWLNHDDDHVYIEIKDKHVIKILCDVRCHILHEFPVEICSLSHLKSLELIGHNFSSVPEEIENLSSLISLILELNGIQKLPESIGNLTTLEKLSIGGNSITTLPETLNSLHNLQVLIFEDIYFSQ